MLYGRPVFVTLSVYDAVAFCVNEKHGALRARRRPNRNIRHIYQIAPRRGAHAARTNCVLRRTIPYYNVANIK